MDVKVNFEHYVTFGVVLSFTNDFIVVFDNTQNSAGHIRKENCDDNLCKGDEIAIIHYEFEFPCDIFKFNGIIAKNRYDSAIRESQQLPKNWTCRPKIELIENFGTIHYTGNDTLEKVTYNFRPFDQPEYLFPLENYFTNERFTNGEEVVVQTYCITRPNGEYKMHKCLLSKKQYDKLLEKGKTRK